VKKLALVLCLLLVTFSAIGIFLESRYGRNFDLHRIFARFSLLSNERVLETARNLQHDGDQKSLNKAVSLYREIISRDPKNPQLWCELGETLLDLGKMTDADHCYQRAIQLGPNDTLTIWRLFEYYTRINQPQKALPYSSHVLDKDPSTCDIVFPYYGKKDFAFTDTLNYGIPLNKVVAQAYLRYWIKNNNVGNADQCWNWVCTHSFADDVLAGNYLSFLIRTGEPAKARDAWAAWTATPKQANLIFNPGFESEPRRSPFDWNISKIKGAEVIRDSKMSHEGKFSLRIDFDGKENPAYQHVSQKIFLEPGTYQLKAFVRTEGITTEQGVGLSMDSVATEQVKGTTDWKELAQTIKFREPSLHRLVVFRRHSWKIANRLSGTVWLDDIQLIRVP
jgi:tetratricopeptide (TPR) repeat protein